jgi:hypothetical protein
MAYPYPMSETARRRQRPITIRSEKAAALLAQLTRTGRSQAEIIEEALSLMPLPEARPDPETLLARIEAVIAGGAKPPIDLAAVEAEMYDDLGLPR